MDGEADEADARDECGVEDDCVEGASKTEVDSEVSTEDDAELAMDGARECRGVRCGVRCGEWEALVDRDLEGDGLLLRVGVRLSLLA